MSIDKMPRREAVSDLKPVKADIISSFILVMLGILFFSDFLFSSKNFYFRDILNFHYPLRKVLIDAYSRGEWPLWNPFIYFGQPMLANPNYMAFYPTNLLHLIFSFNYAFKLHFIIHPILGGLGMYFLQRRLRIDWRAALAGSIAYEFSGTVLSFLNLYNIVPAVALLPWIGWAFVGALAGSWLRRSFLFGVLLALLAIAFEPLIFQCAVLFVAGLSLYCLLESESRTMMAASIFRTGLTGGIFALGLSAVQILPAMELFPLSERGAGFDFNAVSIWSMHPLDFLNVAVPNLFGRADTIGYPLYWGEAFHHGREAYLVSFFLGGATLFLAVLSFLHRRKKLQLILVSVALAGFALALGRFNPIYQWLFEHLNFFHLGRYPSKYFLLTTLAVCILASLGVEVALQAGTASLRERRKILIIGFCGILIAITFLGVSTYYQTNPQSMRALLSAAISPQDVAGKDFSTILRQLNRSLVSTGAYLLLCSMLVLGAARWQRSSLLSGLFWVVLGAELIPANLGLSPLISDADMSYESEIMKFARAQTSKEPYRVVPPTIIRPQPDIKLHTPNQSAAWLSLYYRMSGQPMYGIASGIEYSVYLSVDHLNTRESDNLYKACMALDEDSRIRMLENLNSSLLLSFGEIENSRLRPLRSFDTRSDIEVNAYWLDLAAPRAYFAPGVIKASSREEALIFVSRPDLSAFGNVVLEDPSISGQATQERRGEVKVLAHENQSVSCEVEAKTPGYLVLLDSYYPGWRAWVDGTEASILRANYAFRAVRLSPGSHKVEFKYRPRNFYVGLIVTCLTLLTGVVFCAVSYRKK